MRTKFYGSLYANRKSDLKPPLAYSTNRSKALVPVLVLLFVALWFNLRGDLFWGLSGGVLFLCFSDLLFALFVRLFDLRVFGFVCFLFLLVCGKGFGLWLWHSPDFSHAVFLNLHMFIIIIIIILTVV